MEKTVLICERKSLARIAYKGTLEVNGFDIVGEAFSGAEALNLYQILKPDVVLMSAILGEPIGDGLLLIQKILDVNPDALIVAYSNPKMKTKAQCLEAGAKGFFEYPARPDEMLAVVQKVTQ